MTGVLRMMQIVGGRVGPSLRVVLLLSVVAALATPSKSGPTRLRLRNADPSRVAAELETILRAPVEIVGGDGRSITIDLAVASPSVIMDRVSSLMGGTWRMVLHVSPVADRPGGAPERIVPRLDRNLVVGLNDYPADKAFALVARELRAELHAEGVPETPVIMPGRNQAATAILDQLAQQSGTEWRLSYRVTATGIPESVIPPPARLSPRRPAPVPAPMYVPDPIRPIQPMLGISLRETLREQLHRIARAEPSRRADAMRDCILRVEATLGSLRSEVRAQELREARELLPAWRSLYRGLAPSVKLELKSVNDLMEKTIGAGY